MSPLHTLVGKVISTICSSCQCCRAEVVKVRVPPSARSSRVMVAVDGKARMDRTRHECPVETEEACYLLAGPNRAQAW